MKTPKEPPFLYKNFTELVKSWTDIGKTALIYSRNGVKMQLSYHELQERIMKESRRLSGTRVLPLVMDHEPETLIRLFAAVLAGIDVIAADPSVPQEILEQTAAAAASCHVRAGRRRTLPRRASRIPHSHVLTRRKKFPKGSTMKPFSASSGSR